METLDQIYKDLASGAITPEQADAKIASLRSQGQLSLEQAMDYNSRIQDFRNIAMKSNMATDFNKPISSLNSDSSANQLFPQANASLMTQPSTQDDKLSKYIQDHIAAGSTPEEARKLAEQEINFQNRSYGNNYDEYLKNNPLTPEEQQAQQMQANKNLFSSMPYLYAGGTDITTKANMLGQAIGAPQGTKGKGVGIVAGGLSLGLDLARNIAAGIGMSKVNQYTQKYSKDQVYGVDKGDYMSNPQYRNSNYTGEMPFKFGGELRLFDDGGEMEMETDMEEGQGQPEENQQPQDQQQQIFMAVANVLQQGGTPEQAVQMLVQNGVDQQTAMTIVQQVVQQFQQQQQSQQPQMKSGGTFGRKVGDEVDFTYEGKRYKGVIKKIENGKIFL